jgi:ABC-2 type transport system permease protein
MKIIKKELGDILKEKTFISTLLMQLFLIAFYSFAIMGIVTIFSPFGKAISLQVISENEIPQLKHILSLNDKLKPVYTPLQEITYDHYDAVLFIQEGSTYDLTLYVQGQRPTYIISEIKKSLQQYEDLLRKKSGLPSLEMNSILRENDINRLASQSISFEFTYLIIIPLLIFLPIYLSGVLFIDLLTEEHKRKTLDILMCAPVSFMSIIIQKMIAALLISFSQIIIWIILISLRGIAISNVAMLLFTALVFNILFIILAAFIAVYFKERVNSHILYTVFYILIIMTRYLPFNPFNIITKLSLG